MLYSKYCILFCQIKYFIIKKLVKEELKDHHIMHTTIELEKVGEDCLEKECEINLDNKQTHHHHH